MWPKSLSRALVLPFVAAALTAGSVAQAQTNYPNKPVRIILAYGPGGVADVTTRMVAQKLSERMGESFIIDNRPGAGSIIAAKAALSAPRDGYTLFLSGNGATISETLFKSLPYNVVTDFTSVALLASFEMLLTTKDDSQIDTIAKLVSYAKANPDKLNFGTIALGSTQHLSAVLFGMVTGVKATLVTFRTTPELVSAILRGDIDVGFDYYAALRSTVDSKQLKVIATSGEHPNPRLAGVPTVKDSGYPEYVVASWNALSAPVGVPAEIVAKLNREVNAALATPELQAKMADFGMEASASTPEQVTARLKSDIQKWRVVIEKSGIPKE